MRTRKLLGTAAVALTLLASAGCGGDDGDAVAWTDDVCGALLEFTDAVSAQPAIDPADPAAAVGTISDYFATASESLQSAVAGLDAAGPSPVDGGDEIVDGLRDALTQFRTSFDEARTQLDAIDTSDPQEVLTALPAAVAPLEQLAEVPDPTANLQGNPELNEAAEQAPNCQRVRAAGE
jgi:hypothetical protein